MSIRKGNLGKKKLKFQSKTIISKRNKKIKALSNSEYRKSFFDTYGEALTQITKSARQQGLDWDNNGNLIKMSESQRKSKQPFYDPYQQYYGGSQQFGQPFGQQPQQKKGVSFLVWIAGLGIISIGALAILVGTGAIPNPIPQQTQPQVQPTVKVVPRPPAPKSAPRPAPVVKPFKATDSLSEEAKNLFANTTPDVVIIDEYTDFRIRNNLFGE